jgi:hypothetical protein
MVSGMAKLQSYHYTEWNYDECHILFSIMLSVIVLSIVMLNTLSYSYLDRLARDKHSSPIRLWKCLPETNA